MDILALLSQQVQFFPLVALVALLLAGFNVPISEDLVIIMGALICHENEQLIVPTLAAIYVGVIASDYISYWIGILLRKGAIKNKYLASVFSQQRLDWMYGKLKKYGIFTFIVCRLIPFGVRNTLFLSSGFFGLRIKTFALYDTIAAMISTNTLFFLVYHFGNSIKKPIEIVGVVLFFMLISAIAVLVVRFVIKKGYMKLPLTKYGLPQVVIFPAAIVLVMAALFFVFRPALIPVEILLFLVLVWALSFFRDPHRAVTPDESVLLSPADGTITDITTVEDGVLGRALRIGIFLSIFNVHINRAPCAVRVESVGYKKGMHKDARSQDAGRVNESNDVLMTRLAVPGERLLVRQISGAIARHIVCRVKSGGELKQGERFGMIKFGSRTELYIAAALSEDGKYEVAVKPGDKVRAGLTPLVRCIK